MDHLFKPIDNLLNTIAMYRLALYEVTGLLVGAAILAFFKLLPFSPFALGYSVGIVLAVALATNWVFAKIFGAPENPESATITALILALIISPPHAFFDARFLSIAFWAAAWAMGSKFIFAIREKHAFNPAAFGVALTAIVLGQSASWWVGTPVMLPFVAIGGVLLVRKIRRFDLFFAFVAAALASIAFFNLGKGFAVIPFALNQLLLTPIIFFASVMLTEPLTTPPSSRLRILYGALIGLLFAPNVNILGFYFTPEIALLAGNIFSYFVSPKQKLFLTLRETTQLTPDTYEFAFATDRPIFFRPGQYMEWMLAHPGADSRGARRYFTISSSPTEHLIKLGIKFYDPGSSYKKAMLALRPGDRMIASQLAGDFVLPKNAKKKLVFIAGGIGVTPFRSMIQYLIDMKETRPVAMLYGNRTTADAAHKKIFDQAERELGIKTAYAFSSMPPEKIPQGCYQNIDAAMIAKEVPDYLKRTFYISGPHAMVVGIGNTLTSMGVSPRRIRKDYFPGF